MERWMKWHGCCQAIRLNTIHIGIGKYNSIMRTKHCSVQELWFTGFATTAFLAAAAIPLYELSQCPGKYNFSLHVVMQYCSPFSILIYLQYITLSFHSCRNLWSLSQPSLHYFLMTLPYHLYFLLLISSWSLWCSSFSGSPLAYPWAHMQETSFIFSCYYPAVSLSLVDVRECIREREGGQMSSKTGFLYFS